MEVDKNRGQCGKGSRNCRLCLEENAKIITFPVQYNLRNKKSELIRGCIDINKIFYFHEVKI